MYKQLVVIYLVTDWNISKYSNTNEAWDGVDAKRGQGESCHNAECLAHLPSLLEAGHKVNREAVDTYEPLSEYQVHQQTMIVGPQLKIQNIIGMWIKMCWDLSRVRSVFLVVESATSCRECYYISGTLIYISIYLEWFKLYK